MPSKKTSPKKIVNPLTGRKIIVGGATHMRIKSQMGGSFSTDVIKQQGEKFLDKLVKKDSAKKPEPTKLAATVDADAPVIPKSKYNLIGSNLPPAPSGSHSYYHHHAPFSQDFGDYVCVKKDTLRDVGMFLRDSMFRSVD
jgi:hypothetical protein